MTDERISSVRDARSASSPAPVLDRTVLDALGECLDQADLIRLLDRAATEFPALAGRVRAAWRDGDLVGLEHQAHKLTGLAASFGAAALAAAADRIEQVCHVVRRAPGADMLDDLANAIDPALQALAAWRVERAL